jgi:hypothetical protein
VTFACVSLPRFRAAVEWRPRETFKLQRVRAPGDMFIRTESETARRRTLCPASGLVCAKSLGSLALVSTQHGCQMRELGKSAGYLQTLHFGECGGFVMSRPKEQIRLRPLSLAAPAPVICHVPSEAVTSMLPAVQSSGSGIGYRTFSANDCDFHGDCPRFSP